MGMSKTPFKPLLISIQPQFVEMILSGVKTVELRKLLPANLQPKTKIIIYSSSPVKAIVAIALVKKIEVLPPDELWQKCGKQTGTSPAAFQEYFKGKDKGYGLYLEQVEKLKKPITLAKLREKINFAPPQSYMYATEDLLKLLN